jgi:AraC-like DNA-binding protein
MDRICWSRQGGNRPYYINRLDVEGLFRFPAHDHQDHWEFVFVIAGAFIHEIGGTRRLHEAGRLVLIRDSDVHSLRGRAFSYINLAFPPAWLERFGMFTGRPELRNRLERSRIVPEAIVPLSERAMLVDRFDGLLRIASEAGRSSAFATMLGWLLSYLDTFAVEAAPLVLAPSGYSSLPPGWLAELVCWAQERKRPPTTAEFWCKSGYSTAYVIRAMHRHYGITPARLLADLRLRRAEDLLRFTNYSIARIAEESGWSGVRQFERRFHGRTGCSPRSYRAANAILAH